MPKTLGSSDQVYMTSLRLILAGCDQLATETAWFVWIGTKLVGLNKIALTMFHVKQNPNSKHFLMVTFNSSVCHSRLGMSATGRYWLNIMAKIPYGTVVSYAEFARFAGKPKAARAAGLICANNPIPIIYPCHRVIRTDGKLGNYGAGSNHHPTHANNLARKAALIKLESY